MTEVYHFLRLLFVKLGTQHCPDCDVPIRAQSRSSIHAEISRHHRGERTAVLAPLIVARKGYYTDLAKWAAAKGFSHLRVDGAMTPTSEWPRLDRFQEHDIDLPVGEVIVGPDTAAELDALLDAALDYGKGTVKLAAGDGDRLLSTERACPSCHRSFAELDPRMFSYNSKHGWCPSCFGTGEVIPGFDAEQKGEEGA
jgi:excinuclease ABC subunit A